MNRFFAFAYAVCTGLLLLANEHRVAQAAAPAAAPANAAAAEEPLALAALPAELVERHKAFPGCVDPADESMPKGNELAFRVRLDESAELVAILCEPEEYNRSYAVYIVRDGGYSDAERQFFADYSADTGWIGRPVLNNAAFDGRAGLLRSFAMDRALADCGSQSALQWDGNQFNLVEFRYKPNCDNDTAKPFPLLYSRRIAKAR